MTQSEKSKIEIRDCFDKEGVTIFFSWDAIKEIIATDMETLSLLCEKLMHCDNWNEYVKMQYTKEVLGRRTDRN